jgi:ABC-type sugar transport system ATPase subunit
VDGDAFVAGRARIPLGRRPSASATTLGIRCEFVRAQADGPIEGNVVMDEYMGSHRSIHVETEAGRIVMRSLEAHPVGQSLRLSLDPDHVRLFESESGRSL